MSHTIVHLFEFPEYIDQVSEWIYNEFWTEKEGYTPEFFAKLLANANKADSIPLSLLALVDGKPAGTVNLIENDNPNRRNLYPWLAALVVQPEFRNQGIGSMLVKELLCRAKLLGYQAVYFGTDIPEFYEKLGAVLFEKYSEELLIMVFRL